MTIQVQSRSHTVLRKCQPDDIPGLMEHFKRLYPANPLLQDRNYFDWQFKHSPFHDGQEYTFWIYLRDHEIASFIGYVPVEFWYRGKIQTGCWTMNWASMRKGIDGLKVLHRLFNDFDTRFLIGLNSESMPIYHHMQIPLLPEMPRWVAFLNEKESISLFRIEHQENQDRISASCQQIKDLPARHPQPDTDLLRVERFEDEVEFHWKHCPGVEGYIRRTGRYLNWRYFDIPRHPYQALRLGEDQFVVYRMEQITNTPWSVMRIVEWKVLHNQAERVIARLRDEAKTNHALLIDFFCTAPEVAKDLEQVGFVPVHQFKDASIPYLFRPLHWSQGISMGIDIPSDRSQPPFSFDRWYITKGDSDIDRCKL